MIYESILLPVDALCAGERTETLRDSGGSDGERFGEAKVQGVHPQVHEQVRQGVREAAERARVLNYIIILLLNEMVDE